MQLCEKKIAKRYRSSEMRENLLKKNLIVKLIDETFISIKNVLNARKCYKTINSKSSVNSDSYLFSNQLIFWEQ